MSAGAEQFLSRSVDSMLTIRFESLFAFIICAKRCRLFQRFLNVLVHDILGVLVLVTYVISDVTESFQLLDTLVNFGYVVSIVLYLSLAAYASLQAVFRVDSWSIASSCITRPLSIIVLVSILLVATVIFPGIQSNAPSCFRSW